MREEQGDQEKYGEKTENNKNESDFMRNIAEKTLLLALLRKPKMCTFNTCEQLLMDFWVKSLVLFLFKLKEKIYHLK